MILYFIPFISAAIGWFTNYVAIKMLFHPRQEKDLLIVKIQGIFPKRKSMLAERLGRVVARDLLSIDMLTEKIDTEANREYIRKAILTELEDYITNRFKTGNPLLSMFANDKMLSQIMEKVQDMLDDVIPKLMGQLAGKLEEINIEKLVYDRVMNFSDDKFENLLMSVIKKELTSIEVAGAVLGFFIGIIQVALVMVTGTGA